MAEPSWRNPSWRVVAAMLLFAALVVVGLRPFYVTFLFSDRDGWGRRLEQFPDRRSPGYAELLRAADGRIPPGARVAVVFPTDDWPRGYSYAYYRAQYLLAGRVIVPLSWFDRPRPERIAEAEYVVVYRTAAPAGRWDVIFQNADGAIVRRGR